jgi:hypothetical protein
VDPARLTLGLEAAAQLMTAAAARESELAERIAGLAGELSQLAAYRLAAGKVDAGFGELRRVQGGIEKTAAARQQLWDNPAGAKDLSKKLATLTREQQDLSAQELAIGEALGPLQRALALAGQELLAAVRQVALTETARTRVEADAAMRGWDLTASIEANLQRAATAAIFLGSIGPAWPEATAHVVTERLIGGTVPSAPPPAPVATKPPVPKVGIVEVTGNASPPLPPRPEKVKTAPGTRSFGHLPPGAVRAEPAAVADPPPMPTKNWEPVKTGGTGDDAA